MNWKAVARWLIAALYLAAGYFPLASPQPFLSIMPAGVPWPDTVVLWTGVAEIAGALALLQPWSPALRRAGAVGLAVYAAAVFPANINHFALDMARADGGLGLAYHVPRMFAQPLLIVLTLWAGTVWRPPTRN